jgi:hypothetical protein
VGQRGLEDAAAQGRQAVDHPVGGELAQEHRERRAALVERAADLAQEVVLDARGR